MTTYTIDASNWNNVSFWSGVNETTDGHVLDFSGLGSGYSVTKHESMGTIVVSDGTTEFVIAQAGAAAPTPDATLGGSTLWSSFPTFIGPDGVSTITGKVGTETLIGSAGDDIIRDEQFEFIATSPISTGTQILRGQAVISADGKLGIGITHSGRAVILTDTNNDGHIEHTALYTADPAGVNLIELQSDGDLMSSGSGTSVGLYSGGETTWHLDGSTGTISAALVSDGSTVYTHSFTADMSSAGAINTANDSSLSGGAGHDEIFGQDGNDSLSGEGGNDSIYGGSGDDTIILNDGFGTDVIEGGDTGETNGDMLDLSAVTADLTLNLLNDLFGQGTVSYGANVATYSSISNVTLGLGRDTLKLGKNRSTDVITNFDMTDSGDGTTNDQLDLTNITHASGIYLTTDDVTVTDDGSGNAVLSFPMGESITLIGVAPSQLDTAAKLESIGITLGPAPDYTVKGTTGDDLIDTSYTGDPDGNRVDNSDGGVVADLNIDQIEGGAGNDTITAGLGDDIVFGGSGNDSISGEAGSDTLEGGIGSDSLYGGDGHDVLISGGYVLKGTNGTLPVNTHLMPNDIILSENGLTALAVTATGNVVILRDENNDGIIEETPLFGQDYNNILGLRLSPTGQLSAYHTLFSNNVNNLVDQTDTPSSNQVSHLTVQDDGLIKLYDITGTAYATLGTAGTGSTPLNLTLNDGSGDLLVGGDHTDAIVGGGGNDTIYGDFEDGSVGYQRNFLAGGAGDDLIYAGAYDLVSGDDGNDTIIATTGHQWLFSGNGDDSIQGGTGLDYILGQLGNDTLEGRGGDDRIYAGGGDDLIIYNAGDGLDRITDWNLGQSGTIHDGDLTNNQILDLSAFYDHISEVWADYDDDLTLNQSNTTNLNGIATDYSNNDQFGAGQGITFLTYIGNEYLTGGNTDFTPENTNVACFTPGTLIEADAGEVDVADIRPGDMVLTRDHGYQRVEWVGSQKLTRAQLRANPALRPIQIQAGALEQAGPVRDMLVSPQHRVLRASGMIELFFGENEVLVAARHLVGRPGITQVCPDEGVTYVHIMFERHELVMSDGIWSESFQPGDLSLAGLDAEQRDELFKIFPHLQTKQGQNTYLGARMSLKTFQARLLTAAG